MTLSALEAITMSKTKVPQRTGSQSLVVVTHPAPASYDEAVQELDETRMRKVSVTIDRGLLSLIDHFVQNHKGLTRSEVFDQALELWAKNTQRQADIGCYAGNNMTEEQKQARSDWSVIQTTAAKQLW